MQVSLRLRKANWSVAIAAVLLNFALPTDAAPVQVEMTDQAITDKVNDEMAIDPGVAAAKIEATTTRGIVTLTGTVNNILAKERAARIADAVKGVRSTVNRIEVRPSASRSDADVRKDIDTALMKDPATDSYEIVSAVDDGMVSLTGTVDSYQERDLVVTVAKGVRGVTGVKDQIVVSYKTTRSDDEIKQEIRQALKWDIRVNGYLIDVDVNNGEVKLTGTVGSAAEKRLAEIDAWVAGVNFVDSSNLSVERWTRDDEMRGDKYVIKSEEELRGAVQDALLYDPRVKSFHVDVDVLGSTVTLRGTVDNLKAKRAAFQDAMHTVGVTHVENRLKLQTKDDGPDNAAIAADIRDAFMRDPYIERFEITTRVIDETAHLYGTVDTYFEKNLADDLASRVPGVIDVVNHLSVESDVPYVYNPYVDQGYVNRDEVIDYEKRTLYKSDDQLADAIERELWWSPFVDSDRVNVMVDEGVATLTGTVDSWSEFRTATSNAYEGGATLVDNDLIVESQ